MKARVSPVQLSKPYSILVPHSGFEPGRSDSNPYAVTTTQPLHPEYHFDFSMVVTDLLCNLDYQDYQDPSMKITVMDGHRQGKKASAY